jgi:hypothetical protein
VSDDKHKRDVANVVWNDWRLARVRELMARQNKSRSEAEAIAAHEMRLLKEACHASG